jgi:dTDP-4-dehydrorhamnose reductase
MRLLVTGASGLLGLNLALQARNSHTVIGVDRCRLKDVPFEIVCADLLDQDAPEKILDLIHPDWLIHCAALADLDQCEADPQLAAKLNSILPGKLSTACKLRGVKMVQISTDAVFDGFQQNAYTEDDVPNPLSVYARTKLEGEASVLASNPGALVARVNFFGWSPSGNRSLAEFFFNNLAAGKQIKGFTDVNICPTFVGDLTDLLLSMLIKGLNGVYHAVGGECLSKFAFGVALARRFGLDEGLIMPATVDLSGLKTARSHNLNLSVHKLSTALGQTIPPYSTGLERFYTQFQQGYPQKIRNYAQV